MVTTAIDIDTLNQLREDARTAEKSRRDAERRKADLEKALKQIESTGDDYKKREDALNQQLEAAKNEEEREELCSKLEVIRGNIEKIDADQREINEKLEAAEKHVKEAQAHAVFTASKAWEAHYEADAIRVFPNEPVGVMAERWIPGIRDLKMLTIDVVPRKISSIARQALKTLEEANKKDLPFVEDTILKEGIRSEILDVTQHLNARSMSEARKRVLAASYASSLKRLVKHYGSSPYDEGRNPDGNEKAYCISSELERAVKDTQGFADAVILEQERMPTRSERPGPLFTFCHQVVKLAVEANQLKVTKVMKRALVGRVRAQI